MPLPDHIRKQVEAGKAAFEANLKGEPIPGMDFEPELPFQPALEGAPAAEEPQADPNPPPEAEAPGDPSEAEQTPIGDPPSDDDPVAKARHAAATWKGRAQAARAEQAKLQREMEALTATVNAQVKAIADLQARTVTSVPSPVVSAGPSPVSTVKPEERQQYGEEFSDYMERLAVQAVEKQLAEMRGNLNRITTSVEAVDKKTHAQIVTEFYRDLTRLVPDYEKIDQDPEWVLWLGQRDTYSGDTRKNLFVKACEMADSARAAQFFLGFRAEQDAIDPNPTYPTPSTGTGIGTAGSQVLERMASPGRVRQPASREAPAPEKITDGQVRSFYTDVTKGKYRNRPAEKAEMVARIEAALRSGNLVTLQ